MIRYLDSDGEERMTYAISKDTSSCTSVGLVTTCSRRILAERADSGWDETDE